MPKLIEDTRDGSGTDGSGIESHLGETVGAPQTMDIGAASNEAAFEGYIDFYGYDTLAGGWCFVGWMTQHVDLDHDLKQVEARFENGAYNVDILSVTFPRADIDARKAVGFLSFFAMPPGDTGRLTALSFVIAGIKQTLHPGAYRHAERDLISDIDFNLSLATSAPNHETLSLLLRGSPEQTAHGYIEYYGYHPLAGGWFIAGWVSRRWDDACPLERMRLEFADADVKGRPLALQYDRTDLPAHAAGIVFFLPGPAEKSDALEALFGWSARMSLMLVPADSMPQLAEAELTDRLSTDLSQAPETADRQRFFNLLTRPPYTGEDTLDGLSPGIFLYPDHAFRCGPHGLLLMGWMLAKDGEIRDIRVRSGTRSVRLDTRDFVKRDRPDVLQQFAKYGFDDSACGFIAYLPDAVEKDEKLYIEVETERYKTGYLNIAPVVGDGMTAIRHLLGNVDVRFGDIAAAFDHVVGPAVAAMNTARLTQPVRRQVLEYGDVPARPKYSVIIPLYGRIDFVEYQMGLFSARPESADVEWVFVLDDPAKKREALHLFTVVYERFRIPFRAVLLEKNIGFAPANNIGLEYCHGTYLAYLNSDVFPGTPDWLERLSAQLDDDPVLGAVGPLLQFEDGTVQHRGMYYEALEEYGGWFFCQHVDKGLRYNGEDRVAHFLAITGACMLLRRETALRVGGFDESFIIGDFEDSDLCLKLIQMGYKCGIDSGVMLYHLERKSQLSSALTWRSNLTAYNAWQHQRRWAEFIAQQQARTYKVPQ